MAITSELVETFLKCPTKCFLLSCGQAETGNAYAAWVRSKNNCFRIEGIKRLVAGVASDKCVTGRHAMEILKPAQWRLGIDVTVESQNLHCSYHAVEQNPPAGRGRTMQFVPIRFMFSNKLTRADRLLLAFDACVLSEVIGREVVLGKIVHGENYATLKVKILALAGEIRKLTDKIGRLLASPSPPDLVLNRHCSECEFQSRCRQKATEKDDLSLLSTMTDKERTDFNSKGIFTVTQLSHTFRPRRRPQKLRDNKERYHHSLKALAIREKKIHIVGSPELKIEGTPVYMDVEGLPDRDFYYLIGIRFKEGDSVVQHSLWADGPTDEGNIWREFLSKLMEVENPILIHYGSFETVYLKRMRQRYGLPPDGSRAAKALESPINLLSVIYGQIYFPTYSNGLKEIGGWLGFKWSEQDVSGVQSIRWRDAWEQTKTSFAKEKLITYNLEDCAALELIARAVAQTSRQDIRPSSETAERVEVVVADNLDSKVSLWPRFRSSIEGFETINQAARWDYQRDVIYIRTDAKLKGATRKSTGRTKRTIRVSKVVVCEPLRVCPRCQRKATQTFRRITKCLHDLRFSKSGVTGWVVKYQFQVFWCPACRAFSPWPKEFSDRTTYGRNLAAFSIFEIIELCVSQRSVTQTLNRLFGFQLNEKVVARFKRREAEYYRETRKNILAEMVQGNLIHADETQIRLHEKTAYVWVFATLREVVYFYSETREGSLVQDALAEFKGVLVSDFYAAYDSLACPQQKCLLHLMRDLNDAVLDNPYDEDVKGIVTAFAELSARDREDNRPMGPQKQVPAQTSGRRSPVLQADVEDWARKRSRVEMEGSVGKRPSQIVHLSKPRWCSLEQQQR